MLQLKLVDNFIRYLPFYMEDKDYRRMDSLIYTGDIGPILREHLKILNSPAGMMAARFIFQDPFGLATSQLVRLKELRLDKNLTVRGNFLITEDQKHVLFFVTPSDARDTGRNKEFIEQLDRIIDGISHTAESSVQIDYIGSLPIATANAERIRKDIQLTISMAVVIILLLIFYYFRKLRVLLYILLPAAFGASTAILIVSFFYQKISIIALGIGSVLLGITVDYALHLLTHIRRHGQIKTSNKRVALPIVLSSITTAAAFFCLFLLSSESMRQLGLFAGISVIAAALLTILYLPALIPNQPFENNSFKASWIEKVAKFEIRKTGLYLITIMIISVVLLFLSKKAGFEKDIEKSNYMPPELIKAQEEVNRVSAIHQKHIYLLSQGKNLNEAIQNLHRQAEELNSLKKDKKIKEYHGVYSLLYDTSTQKEKIDKWSKFWTSEKIRLLRQKLDRAARDNHFKPGAFDSFYNLLNRKYELIPAESLFDSYGELIENFKIELSDRILIPTIIPISGTEEKSALAETFDSNPQAYLLDRKDFFLKLFESVQVDFNKLIQLSLLLVFLIILLSFGRIELAVITFIPIILSWVWTLGIMGLTGLKINYFNIIICTLIFGLGVDYSIFITKGLIQKFKQGEDDLTSFRSSILISVLTTLAGLGVLIFAKHPALRSIASLAIVGITSVVILSFTLQPILFRLLIDTNKRKSKVPVTFLQTALSIYFYVFFIAGSLILTLFIPLILILPVGMSKKRAFMRILMSYLLKFMLRIHPMVRINLQNIEKSLFDTPGILISNHQSMIDILLYLSLSPRLLILTKDWVWNNPVYGLLVRFCGHIHITPGFDSGFEVARKRIAEGCSILVFPEGSRTADGEIKRFHKGGFYLAQQLNLPIHLLLVHGAWNVLPRDSFIIQKGILTVRRLSDIYLDPDNTRSYYDGSKKALKILRAAYKAVRKEFETPKFFRHKIIGNYLYKGPVLENYMRVKLRLENYYETFHRIIPQKGLITDIGCGYGAVDFSLSLSAPERKIIALDFDEKKISVAAHSQLTDECNVQFISCDVMHYDMPRSDVFLLSDVLHYLEAKEQVHLLEACTAKLKPKGKIIIRDSDTSLKERHKGTSFSEFLSTTIGFNKTRNELKFISRHFIEQFAQENDLHLKIKDTTHFTSNLIYILERINHE